MSAAFDSLCLARAAASPDLLESYFCTTHILQLAGYATMHLNSHTEPALHAWSTKLTRITECWGLSNAQTCEREQALHSLEK